ncbi:universal stress protein [Paenibacillus glycinis]|uniref:Universal stress protein n=1 Tax=Paenibacillus glycinis TaxID=2697035 RepID=A0ABW9XYT2_9BACL|nr:universal stress protein [Paenibacillus glycinis]NBD27875.1 universal stress protein [Paenibacillus glycinis]
MNYLRKSAESMMREVEESLEGLRNPVFIRIVEGRPDKKIIEYAERHHIDLILMGSRGLSGLKELVLGSVSHYVVRHANVPVFIYK